MTSLNNSHEPKKTKEKVMSYEEKSVGSTPFFKCEACPFMALAEDDIKFHLFTVHPDLAKSNGLADNVQISCPGCTSVFDAEDTLRTHLRNHHKMGIKDVKKMVKSLIHIALKNSNKQVRNSEQKLVLPHQLSPNADIPQVIEIVPHLGTASSQTLPSGVTYISVDQFQQLKKTCFEKLDPKEIIQEASINIVYNNETSTRLSNMTQVSSNTSHNTVKLPSTTPDIISSAQPYAPFSTNDISNSNVDTITPVHHTTGQMLKPELPKTFHSLDLSSCGKNKALNNSESVKKFGALCSVAGCHVRLKEEKHLLYHRSCHEQGTLKCPECLLAFLCVETLHTHLWKTHNIDLELPTCNICGYKTYKRHRLNNIHMKKHSSLRAYLCPVCFNSFKTSNQLSKHKLIHKKTGKTQCETCQREFSNERRLQMHIAAVHDKVRPFRCSNCDYTAARKEELKLHIRCHTGDKPYHCDKCNYRCRDHNAMRRHKKCHTKDNLYKCKYCSYSCIQSTVFTSHMISKHPDLSSNDIFLCSYCPFKSVSRDNYISHLSKHEDKDGIKLLIDMAKSSSQKTKSNWAFSGDQQKTEISRDTNVLNESRGRKIDTSNSVNNVSIVLDDCDSQQESISNNYQGSYCNNLVTETHCQNICQENDSVTDLCKDDTNSECIISENPSDNMIERHQYAPQHSLQSISFNSNPSNLHKYLNTSVSATGLLQQSVENVLPSSHSTIINAVNHNIIGKFPIHLPPVLHSTFENNVTLKAVNKIPLPMTKMTGPIIKPCQMLTVPTSTNTCINNATEYEQPKKKPKISVKSNLILKGPDQVNMFHSQQKMAFKRLEDSERFGLSGPVTFNNLITTQFMQLPPESVLSESPVNIIRYPPEPILNDTSNTPVDTRINDNSQLFSYNQVMDLNSMSMISQQEKIQSTESSYIKLEAIIKQNTQSPSLERMCNVNTMLGNQEISSEYKASPPFEDIQKNLNEIKNEIQSDAFYNVTINNTSANTSSMMDQFLIDKINGPAEQYGSHLDPSTTVLPGIADNQEYVIEIDVNSDENKMLPRFDMNFPLDSLYLMHNEFHFLDNETVTQCSNNMQTDANEINRIVVEETDINQTKDNMNLSSPNDNTNHDYANFIYNKKDPLMNNTGKPQTNKINVKNIELMKN